MPIWLHICLAVLITGYFVFRFIKDRYTYEMLFIIWVPSTLLTHVVNNPTLTRCLGIFQVIMFILVVFFMFRRRGDHRKSTLELITNMMADRLPEDDEPTEPSKEKPETIEAEVTQTPEVIETEKADSTGKE